MHDGQDRLNDTDKSEHYGLATRDNQAGGDLPRDLRPSQAATSGGYCPARLSVGQPTFTTAGPAQDALRL